MRMAKALPNEPKDLYRFCQLLEWIFEGPYDEFDINELDKEDKDYKLMQQFADENGILNKLEFIEFAFRHFGSGYGRVIWGYETLVSNCCDPNKDYLDWKPELSALLNESNNENGSNPSTTK
jgi:hypothetical protein